MGIDILFLQTGGTIDKTYPAVPGNREFHIDGPAYKRIVRNAGPARDVQFHYKSICRRDSQDLEEGDLNRIVGACHDARIRHIIITHGTDTMLVTAEYLHRNRDYINNKTQKTIVLTGAAAPAAMRETDAEYNLGFAVCAVRLKPSGIYIAMNHMVEPWNVVARDEKGVFYKAR